MYWTTRCDVSQTKVTPSLMKEIIANSANSLWSRACVCAGFAEPFTAEASKIKWQAESGKAFYFEEEIETKDQQIQRLTAALAQRDKEHADTLSKAVKVEEERNELRRRLEWALISSAAQ